MDPESAHEPLPALFDRLRDRPIAATSPDGGVRVVLAPGAGFTVTLDGGGADTADPAVAARVTAAVTAALQAYARAIGLIRDDLGAGTPDDVPEAAAFADLCAVIDVAATGPGRRVRATWRGADDVSVTVAAGALAAVGADAVAAELTAVLSRVCAAYADRVRAAYEQVHGPIGDEPAAALTRLLAYADEHRAALLHDWS